MENAWFEKFCTALLALGYDTPEGFPDDPLVIEHVVPLHDAGLSPEHAAHFLEKCGLAGTWGYNG